MSHSEFHQENSNDLIHRPIRRPRTSFTGECMFAASWLRLMASPVVEDDNNPRGYSNKLELILSDYPHEINQRTASIAASFVTWLGTNCGMSFLMEARKLSKMLGDDMKGHVSAWAIENIRVRGINGGIRTVEAVLAKESSSVDLYGFRPNTPILSAAEVEVVENLVEWISSEEGRGFVGKCESAIEHLKNSTAEEERRQRRAKHARETSIEP